MALHRMTHCQPIGLDPVICMMIWIKILQQLEDL